MKSDLLAAFTGLSLALATSAVFYSASKGAMELDRAYEQAKMHCPSTPTALSASAADDYRASSRRIYPGCAKQWGNNW